MTSQNNELCKLPKLLIESFLRYYNVYDESLLRDLYSLIIVNGCDIKYTLDVLKRLEEMKHFTIDALETYLKT